MAPWRSPLSRALHLNRSLVYARYVQLATVRPDGRPANRTVVFRGFLDPTNQLKFITDTRSAKPEQIAHQPWGEVCWYFPKSREQFRLLGRLTLIDEIHPDEGLQHARQQQWQALSDAARLQFAWPHPAQPRRPVAEFSPPPPDPTAPLPTFCLLLLAPAEVDHLQLRGDPQSRDRYFETSDGWQMESVNP
ncbi:pyridoxamine 5'-phosphate oxidase family protein [Thermoleptolyngbya sichuanensis XZ-Cy5]|uniref:Npun_F5749 family FMN-dependent PPOX-type flavoprotein n=1 Tax=Thermoleptolyngbya TaxID=2303528 RepID=UPI0019645595|nr:MULTISPECIES: Npun_F5749 family FMN-dependent PPOX-type flavoprotein [Thermoleptolyngbya]MDG2616042.1 pyridoxamine 5'-phosphate oxidase family protein [Thermoleptolyngbya sichuanensis XZ-Cy5]